MIDIVRRLRDQRVPICDEAAEAILDRDRRLKRQRETIGGEKARANRLAAELREVRRKAE